MIFVDRSQRDAAGRRIEPGAAWYRRAAEATARAIQEGARHQVLRLYADDAVKAALEELFSDKCAYCETKVTAGSDWDVEHFRPKGRVAEREDHPGYYWLAYEWTNLYLGCTHCNQARRDRPVWADPTTGPAEGKVDQFPMEDESARAMSPEDRLGDERPLLLDPCRDSPEDHLQFGIDGSVVAVQGSPTGEASIRVFHLGRRRLKKRRREKVEEVVAFLRVVRGLRERGELTPAAEADFLAFLRNRLLADSAEYAGVARAVHRDPEAFGL